MLSHSLRLARLPILRQCAWMSTRPLWVECPLRVSPAALNDDFKHLLEKEFEYGIANPLHLEFYQREHYHKQLQECLDEKEEPVLFRGQVNKVKAEQANKNEGESVDSAVEPTSKHKKVDATKIHEYKHAYDEAEFGS